MSERKDYAWNTMNDRLTALENNGIPGVQDFFATSALSVLSNNAVAIAWQPQDIAEFCYDIAEAMMIERSIRTERNDKAA